MKKRFVSLILALVMILSLVPTAAFAAGGDYEVEITASQFNTVQYNGKDTMKLDFMLKTNNGEQVTGIQTALLYVDTSKYDILGLYNGIPYDYTTTVCPEDGTAGSSANVIYSSYETGTPPNIKMITGKVAGKMIDGKALLSLEPDANTNAFSFDTSTSMMSVLLGLKENVEWENLTSESVRYATAAEAKAFNANAAVTVNPTSGTAYQYLSADGTADTLTVTPVFEYPFSEPDDGGEDPGTTTPSNFEIYYTLNKTDDGTNAGYKAYGVGDTVKATVKLVNKGEATNLQAYDIYLTYNDNLKFSKLTDMGTAKPYKADDDDQDELENVAGANDKVVHIQAVADDFTAVPFAKDATITLGTIEFTIDGNNAVYGNPMSITLTQTSIGKETTNIAVGGETEGDKESHYPTVTQTVGDVTYSGAEVNTKYTVTFDDNLDEAVTGMPADSKSEKQHNVAMDLPTLSCDSGNYTFLGWSTDANATTATYAAGTQLPASVNENTTLYAVWSANAHTVTWLNYDGTAYKTTQVFHDQQPTDPGTPTYTKEGYITEFKGWATSEKQSDGSAVADLPAVTGPVTYYAAFTVTPIEYTVVFDSGNADGGTPVESIKVKYDEEFIMPANTYTKTGHYSLDHWYSTANGMSGTSYYIGEGFKYKNLTTENNGTVILYAVWNPNTYTITFDEEGGTRDESRLFGEEFGLPEGAVKEGYTFASWTDGENNYAAGEKYTVTGDATLTAIYDPISYTVKYDLDGVDINEADPEEQTVKYDEEITMPTITAQGKTFAGWKLGDDTFGAGSSQKNLTSENGATVTLVAQWSDDSYNVFSAAVENGTVDAKNGDKYTANFKNSITVTLTPATGYKVKDGTVKYFETDESGNRKTDAQDVTIEKSASGEYTFNMPASHVKVTAEFEQIDYTATVGSDIENGSISLGANKEESVIAHYQDSITVNINPVDGYEIESVTVTEEGKTEGTPATKKDDGSYSFEMPASDVTVSATFKKKQITLTFVSDGATHATVTGEFESTVQKPADPTKTGYTFTGWSPALPETMPAGDATYTAQWQINQYTITFDTAGGTAIEPITQDYNTAVTAPTDEPTKTGYTFAGWDKEIPTTMPAENVTITATWTVNEYTITFDTDGGSKIDPITQDYGSEVECPENPTKPGYIFAGWTPEFPETMPVNGLTVKATWTLDSYEITFVVEGGKDIDPMTYDYEDIMNLPEAESDDPMFKFAYWHLEEKIGGWNADTYTAGEYSTGFWGDVTLTAVWQSAASYAVEEYLYARTGWYMLRVADDLEETQEYQFDGKSMYYIEDPGYAVEGSGKPGTFYTLIEAKYVEDNKLTAAAYELLQPADATARATINYNGDINDDKVVNVADANIVYQMVQQKSGNYYSEAQLEVWQRLAADMHKEAYKDGDYRGNAEDVNAIVNRINTKTTN